MIELDWHRSSGPGANDGMFALRIDEFPSRRSPGSTTTLSAVEFARLGVMTIKTPLASGRCALTSSSRGG